MKFVMYHGERVNWTRKIYQLFKDKSGKEFWFSNIKGVWFGSVYQLEPGDKMKIRPEPRESDWKPTDKEEHEYEAQKAVVAASRQERKKAMKLKRPHEHLRRAVELVAPFYRALTDTDRRRFIDWFANECSRKTRK